MCIFLNSLTELKNVTIIKHKKAMTNVLQPIKFNWNKFFTNPGMKFICVLAKIQTHRKYRTLYIFSFG